MDNLNNIETPVQGIAYRLEEAQGILTDIEQRKIQRDWWVEKARGCFIIAQADAPLMAADTISNEVVYAHMQDVQMVIDACPDFLLTSYTSDYDGDTAGESKEEELHHSLQGVFLAYHSFYSTKEAKSVNVGGTKNESI